MKQYKIAVVGATGMVGRKFLQVLEERNLPASEYFLFASERSAGKKITFMGKEHTIIATTEEEIAAHPVDIALFSAGGGTSLKFAPVFVANGAVVIDNSSAWRTDPEVPLVVPEVNAHALKGFKKKGIVANPNCSTIQAMLPLKALNDKFGIERVVYSTYQSVSGAGQKGWEDLENGVKGIAPQKFPYPIAFNCLPHIDVFLPNGYTKEEEKMMFETRKILEAPDMKITATTVRVPVFSCHSESINVQLKKPFELSEVFAAFEEMEGLIVMDDPANNVYPMPCIAVNTDPVYVGRIRKDESVENGLNIWVVADNIRKGAATNAVQIAQKMIEMDLI
ncbi:MAG: aspartate-semialdehyde dehydrogenase [Clostridiales bacterium]|nr:aspartate-semialdehyde dehydrogenase [Clostridiales bacterium]